jgi:putative membrane protein
MVDFSQPQRQSQTGIIVMFFYALQQYARALFPLVLVFVFKAGTIGQLFFWIAFIAILLGIGVTAYLQYLNFDFFLDEAADEFVIREGVFNKTKTTIKLNKIQQVNITQNLLQRVIGVYALDVDTAGSNKKEGTIRAVSHQVALALKARLLENEAREPSQTKDSQTTQTERPFVSIGPISLLKVGITSNYVRTFGLLFAGALTVYENVRQAGFDASDRIDGYIENGLAFKSLLFFIAFLFVVVLIVNIVRMLVRYFGYAVTRQRGSLLLSFGLVSTKSTIIKPEKVQITTVSQNYFQRKLDILELRVRQATAGEKVERKSIIEIPGCNAAERDAILNLLFGQVPQKGEMLRPNFRKLVFAIFLAIVLPLAVFFTVAAYVPQWYEAVYAVPVYAFLVALVLVFGYRNYRLFVGERFIIRTSGAWDVEDRIIEPHKIQAVSTSQLFWHKTLNIGSLTLHTAGGDVRFSLGNFQRIKQHVNRWLYEMEKGDTNWM